MPRKPTYLEYLKNITPINEYLKDSPLSEKSIKTKLSAFDKFFLFLLKRFDVEINDWNEETRKEIEKKNLHNDIFNKFTETTPEKKSDMFMCWVKEQGEERKNLYLNYVWRVQGLLSKMGRLYEANPKRMEKIKSNGHHLEESITYEDVLSLYEVLTIKDKLILKLMMYAGWNGADIVKFKPEDFKKYKQTTYYFIEKDREKTKNKDGKFIVVFHEEFVEEIKEYFERKQTIDNKKVKKDWKKDKKENIFPIESRTISDNFRNCIERANLNSEIKPANIRRLSFTRLMKVFTLEDQDIYQIWTQHKAGLITRHYITDLIDRTIKYLESGKIQEMMYIEKREAVQKQIVKIKEHNGVLKHQNKEIENLKQELSEIKTLIKEMLVDKKLQKIEDKQEQI